jgi:type IV secretory pathway ATPase VirB11/archaellum biosynthesis ATPase
MCVIDVTQVHHLPSTSKGMSFRRGPGAHAAGTAASVVEPSSTTTTTGGSGPRAQSQRFWKPGTLAPGVDIERDANEGGAAGAGDEGDVAVYNANAHMSLRQQRMMLPIYQQRRQILYAIERYQTVIIVGQTGSGKTTRKYHMLCC